MKHLVLISLFISMAAMLIKAQTVNFDNYFIDKTMRIDYYHIGDSKSEMITLDKIYKYGTWGGSLKNLIDNFNNGKYYYKIYDAATNILIYSKGFDSYFGEYKTSDDALKGIQRTYSESAIIPFPKQKIIFAVELRGKDNLLNEIYRNEIDPYYLLIINDTVADKNVKVIES